MPSVFLFGAKSKPSAFHWNWSFSMGPVRMHLQPKPHFLSGKIERDLAKGGSEQSCGLFWIRAREERMK